ncbi:uncharacterized protein LOC125850800 [Solanum stenotomum]|uniref:uncharacterized protein LOC125850800 n=1 Tax=Solanum stenotomum TaxID=172797 RepID=UPI0020D1CDF0|nr:uncharacterized protein LOC125850800 [Solanum stenotomum]
MVEHVDLIFNYGGQWFRKPQLVYHKKLIHLWRGYEVDLLSYIDVCREFKEKLAFSEVRQLLFTAPSGGFYVIEGDEGIRTLQNLLSDNFKVVNFFAVDNYEEELGLVPNIIHYHKCDNVIEVGTDCDSSEEEENGETVSSDYDSEELESYKKQKELDINEKLDKYKDLEYGMTFSNLKEAKQVIDFYAVANKRDIRVKKSDKGRVTYYCVLDCPFRCSIYKDGKDQGFKIKTLNQEHTCYETSENRRAKAGILSQYFKKKVQNNPALKIKDMKEHLDSVLDLEVNESKLKRVKRLVLDKLDGSYADDYNKLEAYAQELRMSNPGTDVVINLSRDAMEEGKRRFLRLYICFQALKEGWKGGLRPFIGLDGTFLKGKSKGIMLVAMGQDSSNHFYPLAWAVVDKETKRTWNWFLELLKHSLDLKSGENVTFISDMQKGLLNAVTNVCPQANHRWCVRHIEANWSKNYRSGELKKLLWWCAWSTYEEEFKDQLTKMGELNKKAAKSLVSYPPEKWCRAYFDTKCKNFMVDNNFTESFNSWIVEARQKPIIKMLEEIRVKVMIMLRKHEAEVKSWKNEFSPHATHLFNDYRIIAQRCKVEFNGGCGYEVTEGVDRHSINIELKRCSCRVWDLSGIPCPHAIKAFIHKKIDPIAEIHWWYSKEAYLMVYKHKIEPVRGENFWKIEPHHAMEPPTLSKMVGRPKMKRTREKDEAKNRQGVWSASRKGMLMTCGYCGKPNHNRRKCPLLNDKHEDVFQDEENSQESHNVSLTESENTQESVCFFIPVPGSSQISSQTSIVAGHDSDPTLYPKVVSESNFRLHERLKKINTGTRKITFQGDHDGISIPTNLPYSPKKSNSERERSNDFEPVTSYKGEKNWQT